MGWSKVKGQVEASSIIERSAQQQGIVDWVHNGRGDAVVEAVAGSGKTTTLIEVSRELNTSNALFLAFNKAIVEELSSRLGVGVTCKTINAIGHGAVANSLGRLQLNDYKYKDLVRFVLRELGFKVVDAKRVETAVSQLISFAQSTLVDTKDNAALNAMCSKYDIELPIDEEPALNESDYYEMARLCLEEGIKMATEQRIIAFNDQIWLPHVLNLSPIKAEWVMVDEAQDLSRSKLELALKCRGTGGRMIFVGDRRQSIYGFAGADPGAFQEIIDRTGATVLPLSVCYRCPKKVVALAKNIVPMIEAAPDAAEGVVNDVKHETLHEDIKEGDLILCRFTAPLIKLCLKLIRHQIPARVRGRDIAGQLIALAKEALGNRDYKDLPKALQDHVARKVKKLQEQENNESKVQALEDRADGVMACYDSIEVNNFAAFSAHIQELFSDGRASVELSTIHRAKGLGAKRVFILRPEALPFSWHNQKPWQFEQEQNLELVAYTRAKAELYFVYGEEK